MTSSEVGVEEVLFDVHVAGKHNAHNVEIGRRRWRHTRANDLMTPRVSTEHLQYNAYKSKLRLNLEYCANKSSFGSSGGRGGSGLRSFSTHPAFSSEFHT